MNKSELIAVTAENTGLTKKDAERVVNAALDAITAAMGNTPGITCVQFLIWTKIRSVKTASHISARYV